ncbi:hypothetical protein C3709_19725 [Lelliottia aquatilis]|uniref:Uncharacterized protein n=1 Tax=Lelliottia aquatilis TaxID=2080838 RepID=A0ABX4ZY18_9ENTR|nr:hypothetical protein C3712_19590 [Lelliottia aquatilis]POZ21666.1 hypothetical protein C3711_20365 [Lelliottia aquatilis]POZ24324.1 hypothetical protein C3708_13965 [Lelliottia sp. 7254-16]POZ31003.1 hypothetical protein C3710_20330 [Lelliottia aquatilis]POZ36694.1 hypothetical protein C3709_19725 [Lelliottia aquatilis]
MCAVVPCQWRRIIGSYSEVTRGILIKFSNRVFFHQYALWQAINCSICCYCSHNHTPDGILNSMNH